MEELDQEKMRMLLEQMNRGPDRSKPVGQQSVGGGVFAPAKTDMGPVGAMSKGVGAINPVAGAASDALLGAVEGASGAIGGVLAAPGRIMSGVGRAIKGLRPFPSGPSRPAPNLSGFSNGMGQLGEMVKSQANQAGSAPPPPLESRRMDSPDWSPSPEANRIGIAGAISPGAGLSQWGGEISAGQPDFDRNAEAKHLDIGAGLQNPSLRTPIVGAPAPKSYEELERREIPQLPVSPGGRPDDEKRRRELLNQYNPYGRRGINPG